MAIPTNSKYAIVSVDKEWSDFKIVHEGKDVFIHGKDGVTKGMWEEEFATVFLVHFEQHWEDIQFHTVLSDGFDDEGSRYLILKREPFK